MIGGIGALLGPATPIFSIKKTFDPTAKFPNGFLLVTSPCTLIAAMLDPKYSCPLFLRNVGEIDT